MTISHLDPVFFDSEDVEEVDAEYVEYAGDIDALLTGVPTGEDAHLEEQFEDMVSGTMFDSMDD